MEDREAGGPPPKYRNDPVFKPGATRCHACCEPITAVEGASLDVVGKWQCADQRVCSDRRRGRRVPPLVLDPDHIKAYVKYLEGHDWFYEYSDDVVVWRRGHEARREIEDLQPKLDPSGEIWNRICPPSFRIQPSSERAQRANNGVIR